MMAKELQEWFPEAQISDQPVEKEGYLTLPLASQQWILLEEAGYNPINQIVGYVLSGDPAYVPRYNNARNQIRKYERDEIVEELVRYYLKGQGVDL